MWVGGIPYTGGMLPVLLIINALFNVVVWPRFYKRVSADPRARDSSGRSTTFLRVHLVLVAIALVLAAASATAAVLSFIGVW
ncbi:MAG: hypothetical protein JWQ43_951 [Glaciihabitans sp.]|nr:hypothetical protein [Glaciihabitans sp.]